MHNHVCSNLGAHKQAEEQAMKSDDGIESFPPDALNDDVPIH